MIGETTKAATAIEDLVQETSGATMIEYALIAALVALTLIVSLTALGTSLQPHFVTIAKAL